MTRKENAVIKPWVSMEDAVSPLDNFVDCTSGLAWLLLCFPRPLPVKANGLSSLNFSCTVNPWVVSLSTRLFLLDVAEEIWGFSLGSGNEWYDCLLAPLLFLEIVWARALLEHRNMLLGLQSMLRTGIYGGSDICCRSYNYGGGYTLHSSVGGWWLRIMTPLTSISCYECQLRPTVYSLLMKNSWIKIKNFGKSLFYLLEAGGVLSTPSYSTVVAISHLFVCTP